MSQQVFRNNNFRYIDAVQKPFPLSQILTIPSWQDNNGTLGSTPTILTPDGDMMMLGGATLTVDNIIVNNPIVQDNIICETISAKTADIIINDDLVMLGGAELKADTIGQNVASATLVLNELNLIDNTWRFKLDSGNPRIIYAGSNNKLEFENASTVNLIVDGANDQIIPNNLLFSGVNQSQLNVYESAITITMSFTGPIATTSNDLIASRIGNICTLRFDDLVIVGTNNNVAMTSTLGLIPARFRPVKDISSNINIIDNDVEIIGSILISAGSGTVTIYAGPRGTLFTANMNTNGYFATVITYNV